MPVHVAGSVQPSQERWDSRWHAFAPSVSRGNRAHMWPGKIQQTQRFLRQESFAQQEEGARKDPTNPTLLATRKLCTVRRTVQSDLVLTTVPESRRKLVPRNTATFARSMGARTRRTILAIAVVLRKTKRKNLISAPLRKAKRNQSHKAVLRAVEREIGLAREGDQEKGHQEAETSL